MNKKLLKTNFCVERKLWNKGFGTETLIPQLSFNIHAYNNLRTRPWYEQKTVEENFYVERKLWNKGFGTETLIPQLSFNIHAYKTFRIAAMA